MQPAKPASAFVIEVSSRADGGSMTASKGLPIPRRHKAKIALAVLSGWPTCPRCMRFFEPYITQHAIEKGDSEEDCHQCWHAWLRDHYPYRNDNGINFDCETCLRNIGPHELRHIKVER
jgi:hypothetical protein